MSAKKDGFGVKFEKFVAQLDAWIAQRKKNEVVIMAIFIPLALLLIDYKFIVPKAEAKTVASKAKHDDIVKRIEAFKSNDTENKVKELSEKSAALKVDIERLATTEAYIQSRLTELDHLFFTRLEWAQHLDFITQKATEHHVTIQAQENRVEPEGPGFAPVMSVSLDGHGSFASVLRYLFLVEASEKITPIEKLTMTIDEKDRLAFTATSVYWGLR
ncbi:MAG: hypothetical protein LBO72_01305 [Helicobacteraceae bacterium]|jgi:hypothetical protein|nr:hypothetical protein [Helicobacteraceae bacterium]